MNTSKEQTPYDVLNDIVLQDPTDLDAALNRFLEQQWFSKDQISNIACMDSAMLTTNRLLDKQDEFNALFQKVAEYVGHTLQA